MHRVHKSLTNVKVKYAQAITKATDLYAKATRQEAYAKITLSRAKRASIKYQARHNTAMSVYKKAKGLKDLRKQ